MARNSLDPAFTCDRTSWISAGLRSRQFHLPALVGQPTKWTNPWALWARKFNAHLLEASKFADSRQCQVDRLTEFEWFLALLLLFQWSKSLASTHQFLLQLWFRSIPKCSQTPEFRTNVSTTSAQLPARQISSCLSELEIN
jgi:hypothetical protein